MSLSSRPDPGEEAEFIDKYLGDAYSVGDEPAISDDDWELIADQLQIRRAALVATGSDDDLKKANRLYYIFKELRFCGKV